MPDPPLHPALRIARGYYHLGDFQACVDAILAAYDALSPGETASLPGAQRLLGMALGRLDDPEGAARALARAVEEDGADEALHASLLSARLRSGALPEETPAFGGGPLAELAGALAWLLARRALEAGHPADAARRFAEAAALFARFSPPLLLGERLAAAYVGLAISYLLAGQFDAAAQAYSRTMGGQDPGGTAGRLARQVFEIAGALQEVGPEERATVLAPLAGLLLQVQVRVLFYDQVHPVAIRWENL